VYCPRCEGWNRPTENVCVHCGRPLRGLSWRWFGPDEILSRLIEAAQRFNERVQRWWERLTGYPR